MCVPPIAAIRSMSFLAVSRPAARLRVVIDDPLGEADGAGHRQAAVGDPLPQVGHAAAALA